MAERCAVIGVGQTHHKAKREDVSIAGLVREAAKAALADADLGWGDIDAVVIGKAPDMFEGNMMPELYLAPALGAVGNLFNAFFGTCCAISQRNAGFAEILLGQDIRRHLRP